MEDLLVTSADYEAYADTILDVVPDKAGGQDIEAGFEYRFYRCQSSVLNLEARVGRCYYANMRMYAYKGG